LTKIPIGVHSSVAYQLAKASNHDSGCRLAKSKQPNPETASEGNLALPGGVVVAVAL
jgi:hypothetical protein